MEMRAHADRCTTLPAGLPDDVDLMIEAKDKEQAVFELYRIYGLHDVLPENLRPPADDITLKTKGRKSSGKWVHSYSLCHFLACSNYLNAYYRKKTQKEGEAALEQAEQPIDPEMIDELADDDDLLL
jgi:hypothetical protein